MTKKSKPNKTINVEKMRQLAKSCALFSHLSASNLDALLKSARPIALLEKQNLLQQGHTATEFFMVISGELKLAIISTTGQEKIMRILGPGDAFAEALMFLEKPVYPVSVSALSASLVVAFSNELYKAILVKSPQACFGILGEYSRRIRNLVSEIESLTIHDATTRVVLFLLKQVPCDQQGVTSLDLKMPKHVIASRLSITPETLSRILSKLTKAGAIDNTEKHVKLHDIYILRGFISEY